MKTKQVYPCGHMLNAEGGMTPTLNDCEGIAKMYPKQLGQSWGFAKKNMHEIAKGYDSMLARKQLQGMGLPSHLVVMLPSAEQHHADAMLIGNFFDVMYQHIYVGTPAPNSLQGWLHQLEYEFDQNAPI